jgi:hypothetical protein
MGEGRVIRACAKAAMLTNRDGTLQKFRSRVPRNAQLSRGKMRSSSGNLIGIGRIGGCAKAPPCCRSLSYSRLHRIPEFPS